jgi:hypothetical protein
MKLTLHCTLKSFESKLELKIKNLRMSSLAVSMVSWDKKYHCVTCVNSIEKIRVGWYKIKLELHAHHTNPKDYLKRN